MFFRMLITAGIKNILNSFLYSSPILQSIYYRLNGKVLYIKLKEFSTPVILMFSKYRVDILERWEGQVDCTVVFHMSAVSILLNLQNINLLIQHNNIKVNGNPQVIKDFISLIDLAKFNSVELLTPYIGDIAAESIGKLLFHGKNFLCKNIQRLYLYTKEMLIEEWRIAPGPLEVSWFKQEIKSTEHTVEKLAKRIKDLEDYK